MTHVSLMHAFLMQVFFILHFSFPIFISLSQTAQNSTNLIAIYTKSFSLCQLYNSTLHMSEQPTLLKNTISLRDVFCSCFDLYLKTMFSLTQIEWVSLTDGLS